MKNMFIGIIIFTGCLIFGIYFYLYSCSDDFSFMVDLVCADDKAVELDTSDIVSAGCWNEKEAKQLLNMIIQIVICTLDLKGLTMYEFHLM